MDGAKIPLVRGTFESSILIRDKINPSFARKELFARHATSAVYHVSFGIQEGSGFLAANISKTERQQLDPLAKVGDPQVLNQKKHKMGKDKVRC